jgi:hypothetical protein
MENQPARGACGDCGRILGKFENLRLIVGIFLPGERASEKNKCRGE